MNIALIAHDAKKKLMQNFCIAYRGILSRNSLYATGTTGRLIEEVTNLNVHKYLAGHLGGEQQICAQIEHNEIDLVIFLRDPMTPKMHEPTVNNILRLCDMHNIPIATNSATAEMLILGLDRGDLDWRNIVNPKNSQRSIAQIISPILSAKGLLYILKGVFAIKNDNHMNRRNILVG